MSEMNIEYIEARVESMNEKESEVNFSSRLGLFMLHYKILEEENQIFFSVYDKESLDYFEGCVSINTFSLYLPFQHQNDYVKLKSFLEKLIKAEQFFFNKIDNHAKLTFRIKSLIDEVVYESILLIKNKNLDIEINNIKNTFGNIMNKVNQKMDKTQIEKKFATFEKLMIAKLDDITNQIREIHQVQNDHKKQMQKLIHEKNFDLVAELQFGSENIKSKLASPEQLEFLYQHLRTLNSRKRFKLLFSSDIQGDSSQAFHASCDEKGPTLTIALDTDGNIFGGYTSLDWRSFYDWHGGDTNSFLFSVNNQKVIYHDCDVSKFTIYCNAGYGPTFGRGYDLCIADNCTMNKNSMCNLRTSYGTRDKEVNRNFLTNGNKYFQVVAYEVFNVVNYANPVAKSILLKDNEKEKSSNKIEDDVHSGGDLVEDREDEEGDIFQNLAQMTMNSINTKFVEKDLKESGGPLDMRAYSQGNNNHTSPITKMSIQEKFDKKNSEKNRVVLGSEFIRKEYKK